MYCTAFFTASLRRCQGPIWPCLCCIQPNPSFSSWWRTTNVPHTSHSPLHYSSSRLSRETSSFTSSMTTLQRQVVCAFCRFRSYKEISWMVVVSNFLYGSILLGFSYGSVVVVTLYVPRFVLPVNPSLPVCALGSREFVYLLWLCYIWPAALFSQDGYLNHFPLIPMQSVPWYRIS